jgi:hypothetical protein
LKLGEWNCLLWWAYLVIGERVRTEDRFLIDRLIAPPVLHLWWAIRREDNERNVGIPSLNHRWKKIRHRGTRGGDDTSGFAGCLSGAEREES